MYLFDAGALAIGETSNDETIELVAGFDDEQSAQRAVAKVAAHSPATIFEVVKDRQYLEWVEGQRDALTPTTIGSWHVRAPWHERNDAQFHDIIIDPGVAFGHGAHPSTRLSLELLISALEEDDERGSGRRHETVVDLGTGTGVLAIVAATTGRTVRAVESDIGAVAVARNNIEHNAVVDTIELIHQNGSDTVIARADLVVANVTIDVHRAMANAYKFADRIIVSGLLCSQVAESIELLANHRAATVKTFGQWAAIDFTSTTLRSGKNDRY